MVGRYGLWPGVVAITADADSYCVPCAMERYGAKRIQAVIDGGPGYDRFTDHEGNPFGAVLHGTADTHGMSCGDCGVLLCDEDCECYQHGICTVCGERWSQRYLKGGVCVTCRSVMIYLWVD